MSMTDYCDEPTSQSQKSEGTNISSFLESLLKDSLDLPQDMELRIERAPLGVGTQSIIAKFSSYRAKEEVIRKAWQKKQVFYNNTRYYVDHDYPSAIIKKRAEYTEVRKVLKETKVKFQTPYPAKLRVFYSEGTRLYQSAAEAMEDMALRGFTVTVIPATSSPDQREIQLLSKWQVAGGQRDGAPRETDALPRGIHTSQVQHYKERLQEFKRELLQLTEQRVTDMRHRCR
ncbi:LINE-1 type transposase domain containing protein 1 [Dissostichus eleginoides]|uniref:LINE-1 type transposase domain containing protein 1 n=1 Tax=Dissostichus eleginoides TaxID=100907 RepID=A0AAD9C567_DISEL|nr:LINE-1 type transposase domain containing protein 1 [Dissostichus eleginoides]